MSETPLITSPNTYDSTSMNFATPFSDDLAMVDQQGKTAYDPEINHMKNLNTPEHPEAPEVFRSIGNRIRQARLDKITHSETSIGL